VHRRIVGDAGAAEDLHAAVGDAEERFRDRDLGDGGFRPARAMAGVVEHPRAPVDHQFGLLQVDQIVGQHEADAFMVDQRLAEGVALHRIGGGDVVRPPRRPPPAHAMGQAGRRQADLGVFEALPDLAQHLVGRDAQIVDGDDAVTARHGAVDGVEHPFDADRGIGQIAEKERRAFLGLRHDDADRRPVRAGDEGLAARNDPMIAVLAGGRLHHRGVRARAAVRLGHEEGRARAPRRERAQEVLLLGGRGDLLQQRHVALVGGHDVERDGAEHRIAGGAEDGRDLAVLEAHAAEFFPDMGREQAGGAGLFLQFVAELVRRPVMADARVVLVGDHDIADEGVDARRDLGFALAAGKVDHGMGLSMVDAGLCTGVLRAVIRRGEKRVRPPCRPPPAPRWRRRRA